MGAWNRTYPFPIPRSESIPEPIPMLESISIPESIPEPIPELVAEPIPENDSGPTIRNRFQKTSELAGIDSDEIFIFSSLVRI